LATYTNILDINQLVAIRKPAPLKKKHGGE